ncbi:MAG: MFS transporter [Deltaproteobacteria bacterium]|nr:MFS transporter [Deltaproteobacteria bacterium]
MNLRVNNIFYGWWIVGAIFIISAYISGVIAFGFTSVFEPIAKEFGWSYVQVSIAASIRGLEIGLLAPVVGLLLDRLGPRKLIFAGALITGLGLILLSRISSLSGFYGAFILIATGNSTCIGVVPVTVAGYWFHRKVSLVTGIIVCGVAIGGTLVPLVTGIIDVFGWRTAMMVFGLGAWVVIFPLSLVVRHHPEKYGLLPDGDPFVEPLKNTNTKIPQSVDTDKTLRQVIKTRAFWHMQIGFICHVFAIHAVITHIMPYLSTIGIDRADSRFVAGAVPLLSILGRLSFGWFGDIWDKRRVTASGIALTAASLLILAYIERMGTWMLVPFLLFFSIGYGGPIPMISAILREHFGKSQLGSIVGLAQGLAMIGSVTGIAFAGWVFDSFGRYQGAWMVYGIVCIFGAFCMFTTPKE